MGSICFLIGPIHRRGSLKKFPAHKVLGLYGVANVAAMLLIFLKLGWLSVLCVFLSYFFMSIMFPTIFALGIFGLGARAKKASAFIVMAIMGGALLPKLMGCGGRQMGYVARLHRAHVLLRLCGLLRLQLVEVQQCGIVGPREGGRQRPLTFAVPKSIF